MKENLMLTVLVVGGVGVKKLFLSLLKRLIRLLGRQDDILNDFEGGKNPNIHKTLFWELGL